MKRIKYIIIATCAVLAVIAMIVAIADLVTGISVWFFYAGFVLAEIFFAGNHIRMHKHYNQ